MLISFKFFVIYSFTNGLIYQLFNLLIYSQLLSKNKFRLKMKKLHSPSYQNVFYNDFIYSLCYTTGMNFVLALFLLIPHLLYNYTYLCLHYILRSILQLTSLCLFHSLILQYPKFVGTLVFFYKKRENFLLISVLINFKGIFLILRFFSYFS